MNSYPVLINEMIINCILRHSAMFTSKLIIQLSFKIVRMYALSYNPQITVSDQSNKTIGTIIK